MTQKVQSGLTTKKCMYFLAFLGNTEANRWKRRLQKDMGRI